MRSPMALAMILFAVATPADARPDPRWRLEFRDALVTYYVALSENPRLDDWPAAAVLRLKAATILRGGDVPPEDPQDWNLPPRQARELAAARDALFEDERDRPPFEAALDQAAHDCRLLRLARGIDDGGDVPCALMALEGLAAAMRPR